MQVSKMGMTLAFAMARKVSEGSTTIALKTMPLMGLG